MLNKVMLIGNLGADPEMRYLTNGDPVATLNVATTRRWKNKNNEKQEETEWHRVTFFGGQAKVCGDYLKKGSKVYIEGRIKTDKYQKDGQDVYRTGIIGESLQMLDARNSQSNTQEQPPAPQSAPPAGDDFDDDIPFDNTPMRLAKHHLI